jgi:hypothetical protein
MLSVFGYVNIIALGMASGRRSHPLLLMNKIRFRLNLETPPGGVGGWYPG